MANYGGHVLGGSAVGVGAVLAGMRLIPEVSLEALALTFAAAYVGGLFPDVDHDSGIGLSEVSGLLSTLLPALVLANVVGEEVWALMALIPCHYILHTLFKKIPRMGERLGLLAGVREVIVAAVCAGFFLIVSTERPLPGIQLWGLMILGGALIQATLPIFKRLTVHRGIFHSVPVLLLYGLGLHLATFRYHADERALIGLAGAAAVLSHLILDEIYAVDLGGVRLKQSFGTALSFWKPRTPYLSGVAWAVVAGMSVACLMI